MVCKKPFEKVCWLQVAGEFFGYTDNTTMLGKRFTNAQKNELYQHINRAYDHQVELFLRFQRSYLVPKPPNKPTVDSNKVLISRERTWSDFLPQQGNSNPL